MTVLGISREKGGPGGRIPPGNTPLIDGSTLQPLYTAADRKSRPVLLVRIREAAGKDGGVKDDSEEETAA